MWQRGSRSAAAPASSPSTTSTWAPWAGPSGWRVPTIETCRTGTTWRSAAAPAGSRSAATERCLPSRYAFSMDSDLRFFVRYGIVRDENMRPLTFKADSEVPEFQVDANGYLFDPRIRELLVRTGRRVDPGTEALAAVRVLGKKMHASMERWADRYGLSEGRFQILVRLHHVDGGRIPMGELAEMLDVSPRTVTGLVDNLERDGLVKRVDDPADRRSVYAEITDQGRERLKTVWRGATSLQAGLTGGFSESELVQLCHLCLLPIQVSAEEAKGHSARLADHPPLNPRNPRRQPCASFRPARP